MTNVLEAEAVGRRYGRRWALRDLSISVPEGRVVALVGPNGAGKSTFLQLAVGLQQPSAGRIEVFGLSPRQDAATVLPRVGYSAQEPALFRRFSVSEILRLGAHLNPGWDNALAVSRLHQLGIDPKCSVARLSGGMRAQVALVLALAKRPRLLLLDEPVASLDPLARHEFMQLLMAAAADEGLTIVLSSHIIGDLRESCDYLVVLTRGQTTLAGDMDEIVAGHRQLVGSPQALDAIRASQKVIQVARGDRQVTVLVRGNTTPPDPRWETHAVSLEQIVIAYLARTSDADYGPRLQKVPA